MANPPIDFAEIFPRGNIGGQFLRQFAITFDQQNDRVRFRREDEGPLRQEARYRVGVMFMPGSEALEVAGTVPGAPGERAGLKEGDAVTAINGRPVSEIGTGEMREIFGSPETVELSILRDGEILTIALTPEKVGG